MIQFPKDFLWGAATAAYQVEGGNVNSDWWPWEKRAGKENSGDACLHYDLYEQDFDLAKSLNHNTHRLSIEWSRIEQEEGKFSDKEIQHYIDVILALRARNIEPVVTLHHFTNPIWLSELGSWEKGQVVKYFKRYCDVVVRALAKHVHYWITINEPTIYLSHSFVLGWWPPQKTSLLTGWAVERNMIKGHIEAYHVIHKIYHELSLQAPAVSLSQHVSAVVSCSNDLKNKFAVHLRNQFFNLRILDAVIRAKTMDFIGVNYYSRQLVHVKSWRFQNLISENCNQNHDLRKKNFLGWDIYPEGLCQLLVMLKKYNLPIMITENGICTADDTERWDFLKEHLKSIHRAMEQGAPVMGYLYWSLLDNFEWAHGYSPRFGLIEMDYATQKRTVRESAKKYAEVCKTGMLL